MRTRRWTRTRRGPRCWPPAGGGPPGGGGGGGRGVGGAPAGGGPPRRHFLVDAESIVVATLQSLAREGAVDANAAREAFDRYQLGDPTAVAGVAQEGAGA